jgi:hypothetical protein
MKMSGFKYFVDLYFVITKLVGCYRFGGGTMAITAVAYIFQHVRNVGTHC